MSAAAVASFTCVKSECTAQVPREGYTCKSCWGADLKPCVIPGCKKRTKIGQLCADHRWEGHGNQCVNCQKWIDPKYTHCWDCGDHSKKRDYDTFASSNTGPTDPALEATLKKLREEVDALNIRVQTLETVRAIASSNSEA